MSDPAHPRAQAGFTLLEIVIGVALIGVVVAGIVGGISSAIMSSGVHRRQATAQTILVSSAESVKAQPYAPCPDPPYDPTKEVDLYSGSSPAWDVHVIEIEFWNESSSNWTTSCDPASLQKIVLRVFEDGNPRPQETISVVKRPS